MKIGLAAISLVGFATVASAQASHHVEGYTRRDGTYVQPHEQTNPNSTKLDNYSTQGNVNLYTGQAGTVNPYAQTQANPYGSPYNNSQSSYGH